MFSIEQDKNGKFYVKTLEQKSKMYYSYNIKKKELKRFDEEHQKKYQKYYEEYQEYKKKYTERIFDVPEDEEKTEEIISLIKSYCVNKEVNKLLKYVNGINNQEEVEEIFKVFLNKCCKELNAYIDNFKQKSIKEPQKSKLPFDKCVSGGIKAINKIKSILEINQDVAGLKKAFKKTLIQKKYNIDINEMSPYINKIFREDEKWWKRIKIGGSHLFSKKATLKGKINALFRKFVNSDGLNDDYETKFNTLFNNLMQHNNARKEIKSDKEANKKLNNAFDNDHNNII